MNSYNLTRKTRRRQTKLALQNTKRQQYDLLSWFMVFNATFKNISVRSWQSVLLVEETGVTGEKNRPIASYWQTVSHNVASSTPCHERGQQYDYLLISRQIQLKKYPRFISNDVLTVNNVNSFKNVTLECVRTPFRIKKKRSVLLYIIVIDHLCILSTYFVFFSIYHLVNVEPSHILYTNLLYILHCHF